MLKHSGEYTVSLYNSGELVSFPDPQYAEGLGTRLSGEYTANLYNYIITYVELFNVLPSHWRSGQSRQVLESLRHWKTHRSE